MAKEPTILYPEHDYSLWIPEKTPAGQPVFIEVTEHKGIHKMHAESSDQHQLYFEVATYSKILEHADLIEKMRCFLRVEALAGTLTEPLSGQVGPFTGSTFDFSGHLQGKWKERRFLWLDRAGRTYRIVYDPTSSLNREILESLNFSESD